MATPVVTGPPVPSQRDEPPCEGLNRRPQRGQPAVQNWREPPRVPAGGLRRGLLPGLLVVLLAAGLLVWQVRRDRVPSDVVDAWDQLNSPYTAVAEASRSLGWNPDGYDPAVRAAMCQAPHLLFPVVFEITNNPALGSDAAGLHARIQAQVTAAGQGERLLRHPGVASPALARITDVVERGRAQWKAGQRVEPGLAMLIRTWDDPALHAQWVRAAWGQWVPPRDADIPGGGDLVTESNCGPWRPYSGVQE